MSYLQDRTNNPIEFKFDINSDIQNQQNQQQQQQPNTNVNINDSFNFLTPGFNSDINNPSINNNGQQNMDTENLNYLTPQEYTQTPNFWQQNSNNNENNTNINLKDDQETNQNLSEQSLQSQMNEENQNQSDKKNNYNNYSQSLECNNMFQNDQYQAQVRAKNVQSQLLSNSFNNNDNQRQNNRNYFYNPQQQLVQSDKNGQNYNSFKSKNNASQQIITNSEINNKFEQQQKLQYYTPQVDEKQQQKQLFSQQNQDNQKQQQYSNNIQQLQFQPQMMELEDKPSKSLPNSILYSDTKIRIFHTPEGELQVSDNQLQQHNDQINQKRKSQIQQTIFYQQDRNFLDKNEQIIDQIEQEEQNDAGNYLDQKNQQQEFTDDDDYYDDDEEEIEYGDEEKEEEEEKQQQNSQPLCENAKINPIMLNLIETSLKGESIKDEVFQQLNDTEKQMIKNLIEKKKIKVNCQIDSEVITKNFVVNKLQKPCIQFKNPDEQLQINKTKNKRVEENQKMFFKKAFTAIENKYFLKQKKKKRIHRKTKKFEEFYEYYFQVTANDQKIDIRNFYHPQKLKSQRANIYKNMKNIKATQKSFNQAYIDIILKSFKFRSAVQNYLEKDFINEVFRDRKQKIKKFILKCEHIIQNTYNNVIQQHTKPPDNSIIQKKSQQALENYILKNSKCKIPWTDQEFIEVQNYASTYLQEYDMNITQINSNSKNNKNKNHYSSNSTKFSEN